MLSEQWSVEIDDPSDDKVCAIYPNFVFASVSFGKWGGGDASGLEVKASILQTKLTCVPGSKRSSAVL